MAPITLDCSSLKTTIDSLCGLLSLSRTEFERIVSTSEVDWDHDTIPGEDQIVHFFGYTIDNLPAPAAIRWFHATRAPRDETFTEGLLPTHLALPKLWTSLGDVAARWNSPSEWVQYRESFDRGNRQFANQFYRKRIAPGWEGPFAFLVRDAALGRHDAHKDFTRICETLEDICADYEEVFKYPLRAAYEDSTARCLVIFTRPGGWHGAVRAALNYAYRELRGIAHGYQSNANFTGRGTAVPPEWIDGVEWL